MRAFVFLSLAALACALPLQSGSKSTVRVTLQVFSGSENPEWSTTLQTSSVKCNAVLRTYYPAVGYQGFVIEENGQKTNIIGCVEIERALLISGVEAGVIPAQVEKYVTEQLNRLAAADTTKPGPHNDFTFHIGTVSQANFSPIVGPDTVPSFDPDHDDQGGFETYCSQNNCYNYGSDIVTNTFAQPGRGSGAKWSENTCQNMNASAIRDGLEWIGTTLPSSAPSVGHIVALLIWPDTNFHWVRLDANGGWSHKPGGTPVRNTDNTGRPITDPSVADLSPWTEFCGYMHVIPSKITIG